MCYQNKRFSQLSVSLLELRQEKCELLDRDNVAIVLLLQPITSADHDQRSTPICVANTHLLFNPKRGDIKLAQLVLVLAEIDSVVRRCKAIGRECEVIFCGDFNSFPNMPLYQFVNTGQLYYHGLPTWMVSIHMHFPTYVKLYQAFRVFRKMNWFVFCVWPSLLMADIRTRGPVTPDASQKTLCSTFAHLPWHHRQVPVCNYVPG